MKDRSAFDNVHFAVTRDASAFQAANALLGIPTKLESKRLALGVPAPGAPQRTPFEKDDRANAGTIMGRKTLDVEYHVLIEAYLSFK
jgi:hypothetical protein